MSWKNVIDTAVDNTDYYFNGVNSGDTSFFNTVLGQWMFPGIEQEKEFAQQVALQEMQNDWNSAPAQVARMKEAGLNPAMLQGNNLPQSPSAAAPNHVSPADPSSAVNAVTQGVNNLAEGIATISQNKPLIGKIIAETQQALSDAGFKDESARGLAIANTYLPQEKQLGLYYLQQNIQNLGKQFELYDKQMEHYDSLIAQIEQQIKESEHHISLMDAQSLVENQRSLLLEQQTFQIQWENGIRSSLGIDPKNTAENNLFLLSFTNRDLFNKGVNVLSGINYKRSLGAFEADIDTAYRRFKAQVEGSRAGELTTAREFLNLKNSQYLFSLLAEMLFRSDGRLEGIAHRLISSIAAEIGIGESDITKFIQDAYNAGQ